MLHALQQIGYEDDIVVVYSRDNGFFIGEHHFFDKRFMYEESIRVPLLVKYPKMIKAGTTASEMVLSVDADTLDIAQALAADSEGNVYVTEHSYGKGTDYDYLTIKYDPQGKRLWEARCPGK